ncbi:MAG TPA: DUF1801 domain-containing protein [Phnomibacter sp.]|mgnify:CR=1 FL=1|nr:DUF1801 domain-containing protein [Phnomibacter sp.]
MACTFLKLKGVNVKGLPKFCSMNLLVCRYIDELDEHRRSLALALRQTILEEVPGVEERLSFKIPFYHYYGMFCYINTVKAGGVELCFTRGKDLIMAWPQLQQGNRAMVAGVHLQHLAQLQQWKIPQLIAGAAHWQFLSYQEKRRFVKPSEKTSTKRRK